MMRCKTFDYQSVCHCSKTMWNGVSFDNMFDYQSVCHYSKTIYDYFHCSSCLTTSQFVTAPKLLLGGLKILIVWLPVSLSLLQNRFHRWKFASFVWLPVSLSLLQNMKPSSFTLNKFDYQSVCHCSKTLPLSLLQVGRFDYQSVCHCSKTLLLCLLLAKSLTTSQFVTAPKQ